MSQDTSSVTYDEPFNGWVFSDDTPVISVPWADGEPNNGVQTSVTSTTDRPEENHAYVRSSFQGAGEVYDSNKGLSFKALITVKKAESPKMQLAYSADALSNNGFGFLEIAYQLNAETDLMLGSELPSGAVAENTGILWVDVQMSTTQANDNVALWLEYDPDGEEGAKRVHQCVDRTAPSQPVRRDQSRFAVRKGTSQRHRPDPDFRWFECPQILEGVGL